MDAPENLSPERRAAARAALENEDASASAVFMGATTLLGDQCRVYEAETTRLLLRRIHNIAVPELHFEKLQCMITASVQPTLLWEINAFENTMACCAGVPMLVDIVQELHPLQIAWGVHEIIPFLRIWHPEILQSQQADDLFDHEPRSYTALMLYQEGFVIAPPELSWAQRELDRMIQDKGLQARVRTRWAELYKLKNSDELRALELTDSDEDVQIARLVGVHTYVRERHAAHVQELATLL
jgi:hypothetical protein